MGWFCKQVTNRCSYHIECTYHKAQQSPSIDSTSYLSFSLHFFRWSILLLRIFYACFLQKIFVAFTKIEMALKKNCISLWTKLCEVANLTEFGSKKGKCEIVKHVYFADRIMRVGVWWFCENCLIPM